MSGFPYIIQGSNIVVVIGNKSYTVSKTHLTYQKVLESIKAQDWEAVKAVVDPKKVVLSYGKGNVSVQGETLFWKGEQLNGGLAVRMIAMLQEGFPIEPMVAFMENLFTNPSKRAVTELYGFLEKNNLPITPDGHFLAYKKVRRNFLDIHSGTMDNSPGKILEMERNAVDDDKDRTCSTGLHFCGMSYLDHFGGSDSRVVIVKINPRDVVSIPSDYNDSKGRACRYEVVGELGVDAADAFTAPVQVDANDEDTDLDHFGLCAQRFCHRRTVESVMQEFDSRGRPLSMTKDAIRKREARARAKAAQVAPSTGGWPMPK